MNYVSIVDVERKVIRTSLKYDRRRTGKGKNIIFKEQLQTFHSPINYIPEMQIIPQTM